MDVSYSHFEFLSRICQYGCFVSECRISMWSDRCLTFNCQIYIWEVIGWMFGEQMSNFHPTYDGINV